MKARKARLIAELAITLMDLRPRQIERLGRVGYVLAHSRASARVTLKCFLLTIFRISSYTTVIKASLLALLNILQLAALLIQLRHMFY